MNGDDEVQDVGPDSMGMRLRARRARETLGSHRGRALFIATGGLFLFHSKRRSITKARLDRLSPYLQTTTRRAQNASPVLEYSSLAQLYAQTDSQNTGCHCASVTAGVHVRKRTREREKECKARRCVDTNLAGMTLSIILTGDAEWLTDWRWPIACVSFIPCRRSAPESSCTGSRRS